MNKSDKSTAHLLAADLNYYGKRLGTAKAAVAEVISQKLYNTASKSAEVRKFLDEYVPVRKVLLDFSLSKKLKIISDNGM